MTLDKIFYIETASEGAIVIYCKCGAGLYAHCKCGAGYGTAMCGAGRLAAYLYVYIYIYIYIYIVGLLTSLRSAPRP